MCLCVTGSTVTAFQWYLCFRSTSLHAGRMLERCTCTIQVCRSRQSSTHKSRKTASKYALKHGSPSMSVHRRCTLGTVVKELDKQPFSYVKISYIFITSYPRQNPCLASQCRFPALLSMTKQPTHTTCCEMYLTQHKTTMRYKTDLQRA